MVENIDRSEWAEHALSLFCDETGLDIDVERDDAVSDLVCNLGHYCDAHGLDFVSVLQGAIGVWDAERREHASGDKNAFFRSRKVRISISGNAS